MECEQNSTGSVSWLEKHSARLSVIFLFVGVVLRLRAYAAQRSHHLPNS